ncbi:MAG: DUF2628 domain-containing protein [Acetobacteraceae bacterium]
MNLWTAHLRDGAEPVLLREGFSWGALIFGPFWLLLHRAWIPAAITLAAEILVILFVPDPFDLLLDAAIALLLGLSGFDLVRWSMETRGYLLTHVLAARTETDALARLLTARPDLAGRFMPPETAR